MIPLDTRLRTLIRSRSNREASAQEIALLEEVAGELEQLHRRAAALEQIVPKLSEFMRWRHVKTGGIYTVLAQAQVEATGERVMVYEGEDGRAWTRPVREFLDGRFEQLIPPALAAAGEPGEGA